MKILHLIASVDFKGGGPIEYARVMAEQHKALGHDTAFVTLDAVGDECVNTFPFVVHAAGPGRSSFGYTPKFGQMISRIASDFDVAIVHGLWNHATMGGHNALVQADLPYVIFTHGMLDPWFKQEKPIKNIIKQIFWTLWQGRVLSQAYAVLFTCEEEKRLARGGFIGHGNYNEQVVAFCAAAQGMGEPDGMEHFLSKIPTLRGRRYFLFLSRIHPKKACDQLISAFAKVAPREPDLDLVIAGPDQTGWHTELMAQAATLGIEDRLHWPGMVEGVAKEAAYRNSEAFVLPSHQENFGLVVAEALSCGTPVLISNKVNIWREVEASGGGIVEPDTVIGTQRLLEKFLALTPTARSEMATCAKLGYEKHFSVREAAQDLIAVLQKAMAK